MKELTEKNLFLKIVALMTKILKDCQMNSIDIEMKSKDKKDNFHCPPKLQNTQKSGLISKKSNNNSKLDDSFRLPNIFYHSI